MKSGGPIVSIIERSRILVRCWPIAESLSCRRRIAHADLATSGQPVGFAQNHSQQNSIMAAVSDDFRRAVIVVLAICVVAANVASFRDTAVAAPVGNQRSLALTDLPRYRFKIGQELVYER